MRIIAAATGSNGGSGSRKPSCRRRSASRPVEPTALCSRACSRSPRCGRGSRARPRLEALFLIGQPQAADAGPAALGADGDAEPLVGDALGALGGLDQRVRVFGQRGEPGGVPSLRQECRPMYKPRPIRPSGRARRRARRRQRQRGTPLHEERCLVALRERLDPGGRPDQVLEAHDRELVLSARDRHPRDLQLGLVDREQVRTVGDPVIGIDPRLDDQEFPPARDAPPLLRWPGRAAPRCRRSRSS